MAEAAVHADESLEPVRERMVQARKRLAAHPESADALRALEQETKELEAGARRLMTGEVCEGSQATERSTQRLKTSLQAAHRVLPKRLVETRAIARDKYGDVDERDLQAAAHAHRQALASRVQDAADAPKAAFANICSAVDKKVEISGLVTAVDALDRKVTFEDGTEVFLAHKAYSGPLVDGVRTTMKATRFTDGSLLAAEVVPSIAQQVAVLGCHDLRVAPRQPFPGSNALDPSTVLHHPDGYKSNSKIWLEAGMRVGLEKTCTPPRASEAGGRVRYVGQLDLAYKIEGGGFTTDTLATSMGESSAPIPLPAAIDPNTDATLTLNEYKTKCRDKLVGVPPHQHMTHDCSELEHAGTKTYVLRVRPQASYATATYDTTVFALEDQYSTTQFASARVTNMSYVSPVTSATNPVFEAEGYAVTGNNSSRPNIVAISSNEAFAVYHDDAFHTPNSDPAATGVDHGAGLRWPRLKGTRSGKPFWYTVALPTLVRDVVTFCGNQPNSFYRLPWTNGSIADITQGNNGSFTHKTGSWNAFAFDLVMPNQAPIYAPRGGIVSEVVESNSLNDDPNDPDDSGDPNFLQIDHEDGTSSYFLHMKHNGVLVSVDQRVRRGDHVATVGNTGYSTGAHLHYQVGSDSASIQIRFEARNANGLVTCTTPQQGASLISTNEEP